MARVKALIRLGTTVQYSFPTIYDEFLAYCENKNLRPATIKFYHTYRTIIEFYIQAKYKAVDSFTLDKINDSFVAGMIKYLRDERNQKPVSINTCLRALKAFVTFGSMRGYMKKVEINKLKVNAEEKEPYTDTELAILLKKPSMKRSNFLEYRNWVIVNYMIGTGNRIGSIVEIRNRDVNLFAGQLLLVHTKNRKRQAVTLTPTLLTILKEYMQIRKGSEDDYIFCNQSGLKLGTQAIVQAIHDYNLARGVQKTSCHLFRHTFALNWLRNGGGVVELQKLLGHSDITMTMKYVNLAHIDVAESIALYNPLEKLTTHREKTMYIK